MFQKSLLLEHLVCRRARKQGPFARGVFQKTSNSRLHSKVPKVPKIHPFEGTTKSRRAVQLTLTVTWTLFDWETTPVGARWRHRRRRHGRWCFPRRRSLSARRNSHRVVRRLPSACCQIVKELTSRESSDQSQKLVPALDSLLLALDSFYQKGWLIFHNYFWPLAGKCAILCGSRLVAGTCD